MGRRNSNDITFEILVKAKHGAKKTAIITECNISHQLFSRYLNNIMRMLVEIVDERCYTTKLGRRYIMLYKEMRECTNNACLV